MANADDIHNDDAASGLAALSVCESLLLSLGDLKIIGEKEIVGIMSDAADAHRFAGVTPADVKLHIRAAAILDRIIAGGNSVRRR
jgi:hypothetical protein